MTRASRAPLLRFTAVLVAPRSAIESIAASVNVMSHFTEWTIGHVHSGALGWNALITFGTYYYLVPRWPPAYAVAQTNSVGIRVT